MILGKTMAFSGIFTICPLFFFIKYIIFTLFKNIRK